MNTEKEIEIENNPTYLAVIDIRNVGFAGGYVDAVSAIDRAKLWRHEGPWPNRRIIGEFSTSKEADYAVLAYITRNAGDWCLWASTKSAFAPRTGHEGARPGLF
jgi:hypothetical protein